MNCPNCQAFNAESAKFCSNCGTSLGPVRLEKGERRMVTVLFADVVGSTPMAETLDPEQVTEIMNGAFAFMNDAIGRHEGTVARLMGDAVMAFFGAPLAHENDPERAIRAGLEIQASAREYAQSVRAGYGVEFNIRVGINTGLVVLATMGDEIRSEYTVMGDTVNVAARLQQVADPGTVLISDETSRLARHVIDSAPRGAIQLKGKSEAVETFEVLRIRPVPGQGRGLAGITSPLVGRVDELRFLQDRLAEIQQGLGNVVAVVGEAGLGKSRLIAEFRDTVTAGASLDVRWLEGRSLTYGRAIPYYPWRELMRNEIGASEGESPEAIRAVLHERAHRLGLTDEHVRFLEAILAVESEQSRAIIAGMDGDELKAQITSAVKACLRAVAGQQPAIVVFEDLHWADSGSLDLLRAVTDLTYEVPLLIVTALRPDRDAPSWTFLDLMADHLDGRFTSITLEPLDGAHSGELLGNLLYIEDLPASIREMILARSEGNPLFLEEIIRSLIDSGHILRENSHWRATREIVNVSVPDTLVGVLSARIDRLPDETKRVAQVAATIGRIFPFTILKEVCSTIPEPYRIPDPAPHLDTLSQEELVRERARQPELEYIFKHVLTQEAAYNLLLVRTRREYHRRAGEVLAETYDKNLEAASASIAYHFWEGEDWPNAIRFALMAGDHAQQQLYALREAHAHFERAYQAYQRMSDPAPELYLDIVLAGVQAALKFMNREDLLERLTRAEEIARQLDDREQLSQVLHWIAHIHTLSGFVSRAMPALIENYKLSTELGDQRLSLYPNWAMAFAMLDTQPAVAAEKLVEVAERARQYRNRHLETHGAGSAAVGYARLGEFDTARQYLEWAEQAANLTDEPVTLADFHLLASFVYLEMGEYATSMEHGRIGTDTALAAGALECAATGFCAVGMNKLATRNPDDALSTFEETASFRDQIRGDTQLLNELEAGMAVARYYTGQTQDLSEITAALERSRSLDYHYTVAMLLRTLAEAYLERGEIDLAEKHLVEALEYYERNQMRPHINRMRNLERRIVDRKAGSSVAESPPDPGELAPNTITPPEIGPSPNQAGTGYRQQPE